jgi:hypothetical protein
MAIVVEQEKKPVNWINIAGITVFVLFVFALAYYLFFKKPESIEVVLPSKLQTIDSISKIQVDATPVVNNLNKYFITNFSSETATSEAGRENPFVPY